MLDMHGYLLKHLIVPVHQNILHKKYDLGEDVSERQIQTNLEDVTCRWSLQLFL